MEVASDSSSEFYFSLLSPWNSFVKTSALFCDFFFFFECLLSRSIILWFWFLICLDYILSSAVSLWHDPDKLPRGSTVYRNEETSSRGLSLGERIRLGDSSETFINLVTCLYSCSGHSVTKNQVFPLGGGESHFVLCRKAFSFATLCLVYTETQNTPGTVIVSVSRIKKGKCPNSTTLIACPGYTVAAEFGSFFTENPWEGHNIVLGRL